MGPGCPRSFPSVSSQSYLRTVPAAELKLIISGVKISTVNEIIVGGALRLSERQL